MAREKRNSAERERGYNNQGGNRKQSNTNNSIPSSNSKNIQKDAKPTPPIPTKPIS